jgi:hypothetical protein
MDVLLLPVFLLFLLLLPVLFLALLLYAVPVRIAATLVSAAARKNRIIEIAWGGFALRVSGDTTSPLTEVLLLDHVILSHAGTMEMREEEKPQEPFPEQVLGDDGHLDTGELIHLVQHMVGPVGSFAAVVWQRSRFAGAEGTVTLGLGNPALTGEVYGYYWASRFLLQASRIDITMQPVFDRPVLEMDITVREEIAHPLLVLLAGLDLARNPSIRAVMANRKHARSGGAGA